MVYAEYLVWRAREGHIIKMNDEAFDRSFLVKSNKESEVRTILDQSIRNKILNIRNFAFVIGLDPYAFTTSKEVKRTLESYADSQVQNHHFVPQFYELTSGAVLVTNLANLRDDTNRNPGWHREGHGPYQSIKDEDVI